MIVTEIPVTLTLPRPSGRSRGVHVSSIIRCIATEEGILKPEWAEELSLCDVRDIKDPVAILRISLGLAWEQYYIPEILGPLFGVLDHPGERQVDGIYMTHDGESIDVIQLDRAAVRQIVHEIKLTWKSTKTVSDLSTQWMWLSQCKAYCKSLNTRFAMLHVFFVNGDYTFPLRPALKAFQIEFSQTEIDGNWQLLTEYRDNFEGRV